MISAYLLIVTKSGAENTVKESLEESEEVENLDIVYGEYDLVAKVKVGKMEELQRLIIKKIRSINEVDRTSTMICLS